MSTERDNRMVWDGRPSHYEVWYLTLSHLPSRTGFWIRYTLESPRLGDGEPYAQLWFARFDGNDPSRTFGVNRRFPAARLTTVAEPFSVTISDSVLRHDGMAGSLDVEAGGDPGQAPHHVTWNLRWTPSVATHHQLPPLAYLAPVDTRVLSPNLDVAIDGEIVVDGERYELRGAPGGQTHLWGKKHAYSWGWSHCNAFESASGSLERTR